MNCEACRKKITGDEVLRCTQCMKQYHFVCLNLTPAYYKANLGELRRSWMCPLCINITRRKGNNCNTPIRQQQANMDDSNMSSTSSASITLDQFSRLLDSKLDTKLDSFQKVLTETIRKEVSDQIARLKSEFTTTTDFLAEEQKDIRTELGTATDRIRKLEDEKMQLQTSLSQINKTVQILDKSSRNCNIEIQSVPEKRSENLLQALKKLCEVINCTISESDIKSIRRVAKLNPSSDRPRNIIVSLHSELHRDTIISAVRRFNRTNKSCPLNSSHLGFLGEKCNIYVSEHLSADCKAVHAAARHWAKTNQYKFVWVKYGRVYIRRDEESTAILVRDTDSLSKLTCSKPV
ncbi:hypothetical protein ACJJTC_003732 [Scirpophaga incertulas]